MNSVVITQVASTLRGMPAEELAELAAEIFGAERVRARLGLTTPSMSRCPWLRSPGSGCPAC